ncbi:MAG: DUF3696 domain-containing protein [Planctomycetia bacterium]|nr:DUF3696 domain-containing protein [Planctomycetia bacterium]
MPEEQAPMPGPDHLISREEIKQLLEVHQKQMKEFEVRENRKTRNLLKAVELENFKGIGERVRLELKPITLLFGGNSAGKSTILHALHYAREILERHNLNPDRTIAGGKYVDLGGFLNMVHQHDPLREIKLGFELDLHDSILPSYYNPGGSRKVVDYEELGFADQIETAKISLSVARKQFRDEVRFLVIEYAVEINGQPLARINTPTLRSGTFLYDINYHHPIFANWEIMSALADVVIRDHARLVEKHGIYFDEIALEGQHDSLPAWGQCLPLGTVASFDDLKDAKNDISESMISLLEDFNPIMSQLIVGPGEILLKCLQNSRYLGPIRETPSRNYSPPNFPAPDRWASGLAAWDMLSTGPGKYVQQVSDWMSQPERLNTGYRLERKQYKKLDLSHPLMISLITGRAFDEVENAKFDLQNIPTESQLIIISETKEMELLPSDVGIGISQILPVIAAAMGEQHRLIMMEQPELHVHPRIQAALGDLFIETALGKESRGHEYLIETHSEHLILRLLRRIRETNESTISDGVLRLTPDDVAVNYVEATPSGTVVRNLRIDEQGEFLDRWPQGFFEERAKELFS